MKTPRSWLSEYVNLAGISDHRLSGAMTFAGNKIEAIHKVTKDTVFEFEITSNRPDTLSVLGLAREAAAILNRSLKLPTSPKIASITKNPISLTLKQPQLCPTYSLVEISSAAVKPSTNLIQHRLKLCDIQPVNNVVDITNYLMLETGQPMHAFDADEIVGPLVLRAAKPGEKITPLDHRERLLKSGEIIIEDSKKLIDLAGLMGGLNTEITSTTTRILLLVPVYDPVAIRRASKFLNLRTEASLRFEKLLDLTQTHTIAARAIKLIESETDGHQSSKLLTHPSHWRPPTISLTPTQVTKWVGQSFTQTQIDTYFKSIGITKTSSGYQPPHWRRDLSLPVDLIEEVSRLHGYNKLPKTLPEGSIPTHKDSLQPNWLRLIRSQVASLGYTETYSSTLISKSTITSLGLKSSYHLKVLHPMSQDYEYMRLTVMESLIPTLIFNLRHTAKVKLFELGTVFYPAKSATKLPHQPQELGLITTISNYRQLKGDLESLAQFLNIPLTVRSRTTKISYFDSTHQAAIYLNQTHVGNLGQVRSQLLPPEFSPVLGLTLNVSLVLPFASLNYRYQEVPAFPPIIEDLTFTLKPKTYVGEVIDEIMATSKLVDSVELKDTYQQNYTFTITYRNSQKSLTDPEIAPIRRKICSALQTSFSAKLVGKV